MFRYRRVKGMSNRSCGRKTNHHHHHHHHLATSSHPIPSFEREKNATPPATTSFFNCWLIWREILRILFQRLLVDDDDCYDNYDNLRWRWFFGCCTLISFGFRWATRTSFETMTKTDHLGTPWTRKRCQQRIDNLEGKDEQRKNLQWTTITIAMWMATTAT